MNKTVIAPLLVFLGLIGSIVLMAGSSVFTPLIQFIHNDAITPLQAGLCLVFSLAGFAVCYVLLNLLCSYFVPRMDKNSVGCGALVQTNENGGNQANKR